MINDTPETKLINGLSIGGGVLITVLTSWYVVYTFKPAQSQITTRYIYILVQRNIRGPGGIPLEVDGTTAEELEYELEEHEALLSPSDDT